MRNNELKQLHVDTNSLKYVPSRQQEYPLSSIKVTCTFNISSLHVLLAKQETISGLDSS